MNGPDGDDSTLGAEVSLGQWTMGAQPGLEERIASHQAVYPWRGLPHRGTSWLWVSIAHRLGNSARSSA
jgi:hypothetical protein